MSKKVKYYSLNKILSYEADYNIIFGERSNGKTYSVLEYGLKQYVNNGGQMAIIRRWKEDIRGKRAEAVFTPLVSNDVVTQLTGGKFSNIIYDSGKWYLAFYDDNLKKFVRDSKAFCYAFAINDSEHDKSTSYPDVTTILFDEFLTRKYYLPDEFVLFMNVLSTIIRQRDNVKIFMLGNTVNKFCPYFAEFGLKHIDNMQQGKIDLYEYGESKLKVAVEYCGTINKGGKPSDKYFAFDNPKLHMITGGKWELAIYPHLKTKYEEREIVFMFFIRFDGKILQCEVIQTKECVFMYIHRKTTPIQNERKDIIFQLDIEPFPNIYRSLLGNTSKVQRLITQLFNKDLVFYQDNDVGEIVRNYIINSSKSYLNI